MKTIARSILIGLPRKEVGHSNNGHFVSQPGLLAAAGENTGPQKAALPGHIVWAAANYRPELCLVSHLVFNVLTPFEGCAEGGTTKKLAAIVIEILRCQVSLSRLCTITF